MIAYFAVFLRQERIGAFAVPKSSRMVHSFYRSRHQEAQGVGEHVESERSTKAEQRKFAVFSCSRPMRESGRKRQIDDLRRTEDVRSP